MKVSALLPTVPLQAAIADQRRGSDYTTTRYVSQRTYQVRPPIDPALIASTWEAMHDEHDVLRARIVEADGRWLQAVFASPPTIALERLRAATVSEGRARELVADLQGRHVREMTLADAPAASLGLVQGDAMSTVVLTWRHDLLDGAGVAVLVDALQQGCAGMPSGPTTRLADVVREIAARPPMAFDDRDLGPAPEDLSWFPELPPGVVTAHPGSLSSAALLRHARRLEVTPTALSTAAWIGALVDVVGFTGAVATVEDARPVGVDVPGMFAGVGMAWHPPSESSLTDLARRLHRHRRGIVGRRPIGLLDHLRAPWASTCRGLPDVLLTVHPLREPTAAAHGWTTSEAQERTEFALSVDVVLDGDGEMVVHHDPARVPDALVSDLVERVHQALADPGRRSIPGPRPISAAGQPDPDAGRVATITAMARQVLADGTIQDDTDLRSTTMDSLSAMRLSVALAEAGVPVSVTTLLSERTPRRIARALLPAAQPVAPKEVSPLEASLLDRTTRHHLGPHPAHEQSLIVFDEVLDGERLVATLAHLGAEIAALSSRWSSSDLTALERAEAATVEIVEADNDDDLVAVGRSILAMDLQRGFSPGDHLYRAWLVTGSSRSAWITAWHNAVLDGWSCGTLMRLIQRTYRALQIGHVPASPSGARIEEYRAWVTPRPADGRWWEEHLDGVSWPRSPSPHHGDEERCVVGPLVVASLSDIERAIPPDSTPMTAFMTVTGHALMEVTGSPPDRPVGMRLSLRPPEIVGVLRMIGMVTFEAPIPLNPEQGWDDVTSVTAALAGARDHGHIGERGVRAACACPDDSDLFDLLVVPETELADDEWAVRVGGEDAWPEVEEWRREISPSQATAYLHCDEESVSIRLSTVGRSRPEAQQLARTLIEAIQRRVDGHGPRSWPG